MSEETILNYLKKENVYQTQFGSKAMGLTERVKKQIEEYSVLDAVVIDSALLFKFTPSTSLLNTT